MARTTAVLALLLAACARPHGVSGYAPTKAASTARGSLEKRTLVLEDGGKPGASAFGPLARRTEHALTEAEAADLLAKANAVWASSDRLTKESPIADFDVRVILGDGDAVRDVDSHGPAVGPVDALYTAAMDLAAPAK